LAQPRTIAIDGSAASGKSTLGNVLAKRLNYLYLDTGVMYRSVTWAVLKANIDVADEARVSELAQKIDLKLSPPTLDDGRQYTVLVNGQDITWLIRSPEVDVNVSKVSAYLGVRQAMISRQREIAQKGPVVMVGRDIGTVVLPDADLKIFIRASLEVRAKRRHQECLKRDEKVSYDEILAAMARRDQQDRERTHSPMVPAPDAIIIDTDHLTSEQVLQKVESLIFALCVVR
jgi:cytidylate kinase